MALTQDELAVDCMEMIAYTGEGRSFVYEALSLCMEEKWEESLAKIEEAEAMLSKAHTIQFSRLMAKQARGEEIPCNMLLLHAMDLLMVTTSEKDMLKAVVSARVK